MTEDQQTNGGTKERKTSIHDIRNQDFVSRLLAATPPYLYSAPVGPNNFFFSDMLRSLVQAKNNENARNLQMQQAALARRPRKRSWSQQRPYYEHLKERKEMEEKMQTTTTTSSPIEKPLELTNKQIFPIASKYSKHLESLKENSLHINNKIPAASSTSEQTDVKSHEYEMNTHPATHSKSQQHSTQYECATSTSSSTTSSNPPTIPDPPTASLPPSDLALPPPPPVWYPSLYPPYGIDPLHFFIDLRVSGHIYDRKKENESPASLTAENSTNNQNENSNSNASITEALVSKYRHGSAFTVPTPRGEKTSAINLSAAATASTVDGSTIGSMDKHQLYNKIYDLSETKENHFGSHFKNANYVLQNLPKLYSQFTNRSETNENLDRLSLIDNKSDVQDDDDDIDEQKENAGHIDVEMIGDRCQSPDDDDDVIHQID